LPVEVSEYESLCLGRIGRWRWVGEGVVQVVGGKGVLLSTRKLKGDLITDETNAGRVEEIREIGVGGVESTLIGGEYEFAMVGVGMESETVEIWDCPLCRVEDIEMIGGGEEVIGF